MRIKTDDKYRWRLDEFDDVAEIDDPAKYPVVEIEIVIRGASIPLD